ncbi:MAG TPA: HTTM domain-containing protein [Polyangiales bacterium]|nr:HTTM domain-containing protein [Polyangiales bacterium]
MSLAANPLPGWLERFCRRHPLLRERYLALDPRSLGLVRIYLGCLLLVDLLRRLPELRTFYSNEGPLPNHVLMWRPVSDYQFSLFFLASRPGEALFLFALCGIAFALFTIGYRTRLMHVLSLVAICSLHNRLALFEDGSEVTTRLLTFWTLFLPLGARFSVDAARSGREPETRPAISLAVPGILLQIALLYTFNVLHKTGETWRDGSAVHYVLHQDRIVSWLGWKLRPHITPLASQIMSYAAVATEALLPPLILSPLATKLTRRVAILLAVGLHLSFAALLNLGMFSYNMIGFFLLLLSDRDWALFARLPRPQLFERLRATALALGPKAERQLPRFAAQLREATVVLFSIALGSQMMVENQALPNWLRVQHQPLFLHLLVEYPRFKEGWSMFAPEVPKRDSLLYVDAVTVDGRHVDPVNELASRVARLPLPAIPEWLDQSDSWCDYMVVIPSRDEYYGTLADFIRSYPRRTHERADRIASFEVWLLEDDSPPPGESRARNPTRTLLFRE